MRRTSQNLIGFLIAASMAATPGWATCGGGGGGGDGGGTESGSAEGKSYKVPWKEPSSSDSPMKDGLVVYWFPKNDISYESSTLRVSRPLSLYAAHCVSMLVIRDPQNPIAQKYANEQRPAEVVVTDADGNVINTMAPGAPVEYLEALINDEVKKRGDLAKSQIDSARGKVKAGDKDGAISDLRAALQQKCLIPRIGRQAESELRKLGVTDVVHVPLGPNFDQSLSARIVKDMDEGLTAERQAKYPEAGRLYSAAHEMDPADPTPLRYLGELYRHHIGNWPKATKTFQEILDMQSDPLSRAVALQGIGKMTIHNGEFKKGEQMIEQSLTVFPLAIAARNLAVYWNSEGDPVKAEQYAREAMKLAPHDPFNAIFAATMMIAAGHGQEALEIARKNENVLDASYNLAAIYAQMGQKDKALALLKRHFYEYERYPSVRSKEMMEARVDHVFSSLIHDPDFLALTSGADNRLPMPGMNQK